MPHHENLQFRIARSLDAETIAALHADSWRRHYRGAYSDTYLDGDVAADRLAVWTSRLGEPDSGCHTVLAEDGDGLVGFAHTALGSDPIWGAQLDNLHVAQQYKRRGIGTRLLALTARAVVEHGAGLYLWVLEQNVDAQAFYQARGGRRVGQHEVPPPGGIDSRLNGAPISLRYAWTDPSVLLTATSRPAS